MSSGAVAASDPGGGETKLAAGADVTIAEAEGEVPAFAADVKVEGKAPLAMDVAQEGGDVAVTDPLYATESAGMVGAEGPEDEPMEGVEAVNGEDGGEEGRLEVGAGGLLTETERKPVMAVDVAAAAAGSATPEHVEAESNELEENHVNAEPARKNDESDNGVAHSDAEIQNNVPGDIDGSSKEHEVYGGPAVEQPDSASEMLPQTTEQLPDSGNGPDSDLEAASLENVRQGARYSLPPLDKSGFQATDLVWGKVKSHPWWPGEIFDPSDASELALKHQRRGSHLVAYFGDNTFAWCDESQLKPFVTNYSQMEKQSTSDAFVGSVNNALEELSRRILSGMSCSCLPEELADNGMSYTVDNAGLKDGVTCSAVNRPEILNCFSPQKLLHYIKELAVFPGQGGDLLELVIACSQLTSFYRSKGCPELASFQTGDAWVEDGDGLDGTDTLSIQNVVVEEPVIIEVPPPQDKPKRGRGRPRKQKPGDGQVVMEKRSTSNQVKDISYNEKQVGMDFDDYDNLNKKKRNFDSFEDSEKSSAPTGGSSFKIGECIRRAASQLTGSSSIMKAQNEPTAYKNAAEGENGEFDISSDDAGDELTVEKRAKRRRLHRNHTADPKELLSQLCMVATEPMNGYSFSPMIISYFNDYRNYIVSTTTEANIVDKGTSRRGRKRKEVLPSPEVETTDHMQDSYWSGLSLHNHPIHDLRKESSTARPRRRRRSSRHAYEPSSELGDPVPKKQIQVMERSIIHVDEKMVDELKPTALVLSFGRSAALPSELDLVKMFSRYGPLKEKETEVHKETKTVKVVFKKRADAERAFSVAGKYGTFGPSLRSYRLVNMPFSLETLSANNPVKHPEDHDMEIPGSTNSEAPKDSIEVDPVQNTDKVEAAGELLSEEVETVRQTSQVEATDSAFVSQADRLEKAGKMEAEPHVNQIGKVTQAASVPEVSSQQVGDVEQDYTQKEASISDLPTETEALRSDAIKELPQNAPDDMETDVAVEAAKQSHISGDNAVFEAVTEAPSTSQDHTEDDTENEVLEEHMVSPELLQSQTSGEKLVGQTATEQKVGQTSQVEATDSAFVSQADRLEKAGKMEAEPHVNQIGKVTQAASVPEVSSQQVGDVEQDYTQKEASISDLPTETETLRSDAIKELPPNAPDDMETDVAVEAAKQSHISGDNAVFEAVTEAPSTSQDHTEDDTENEVLEEHMVSPELLQSQTSGEKLVGQTATEQKVGPEDPKSQAENFAAEPFVQGAIEQVEVGVESKTTVEASGEQGYSIEQTVQVEAVIEASSGRLEGTQISGDESMAGATTEHSTVMVDETVEAEAVPVQENIENNAAAAAAAVGAVEETAEGETKEEARDAAAVGVIEETAEGETKEEARDAAAVGVIEETAEAETKDEAPDEKGKVENKEYAHKLAGETKAGEITVEAPVEKTENKADADTLAGETKEVEISVGAPDEKIENEAIGETTECQTTAGAPVEEAITAEEKVEDVKVLDDKSAAAEKPVENATVVTHENSTVDKTLQDAIAPADTNTTNAEKTAVGATAMALEEGAPAVEKTIEDTSVEAPDVQAGASE